VCLRAFDKYANFGASFKDTHQNGSRNLLFNIDLDLRMIFCQFANNGGKNWLIAAELAQILICLEIPSLRSESSDSKP